MDHLNKAQIISEFTTQNKKTPAFKEFFIYNDLGVPLSLAYANNLIVKLSSDGLSVIDETWKMLCLHIGVDPEEEYEGIDDLLIDEDDEEEEE